MKELNKYPFHTGKMLKNQQQHKKISNRTRILSTIFHFSKAAIQIKPTLIVPPGGISHNPDALCLASNCGQLFVNRAENSKQQQVPNLGYYHGNSYIRKDLLSYENLQ